MIKMKNILMYHERSVVAWYFVAILIGFVSSSIFYPGLFSTDSFFQLNQAIYNSYNSWHPAIMAIQMHYLLPLLGEGGILVVHQFVYWLGVGLVIDAFFKRNYFLYLMGCFPPLLMTSIAVWKDAGSLAYLICAVGFYGLFLKFDGKNKKFLIFSIISLLLSTLIKWPSIFTACIMLLLSVILFYGGKFKILKGVLVTVVFVLVSVIISTFINKLYDVEKLNPLPSVLLWDIAGICHFSDRNCALPYYIDVVDPVLSKEWLKNYNSKSCSLCWTSGISCNLNKRYQSHVIIKSWFEYVTENPTAYLQHRWHVTKNILGMHRKVYFPHHDYGENLREGGAFLPSQLGILAFDFFSNLSKLTQKIYLYQPITWVVVMFFAVIYLMKECSFSFSRLLELDVNDRVLFIISISGLFNTLPLLMIAPAADFRYVVFSDFAGLLVLLLLIRKFYLIKRDAKGSPSM